MTTKVMLRQCKINLAFHCFLDRVKTSELSMWITHSLAVASFVPFPQLPTLCSGQMRYGLNHSPQCVYLSWFWALHLLFPRWGVYFYPLTVGPVSSPLSFKARSDVTSGSILPSSSQLLLKCLCLYFSFYSLCSVVVYLNTLALLELSFTQVCMSCQSAKSSSLLAIE